MFSTLKLLSLRIALTTIVASLLLFLSLPALAAGGHEGVRLAGTGSVSKQLDAVGKNSYGTTATKDSLPQTIGLIINSALGLLGAVLLILIIYGGFLWMTAQGDIAVVDKARKVIIQAVIGMAITMSAYAISAYVVDAILTGTTGT